jgi:ribosomal protein S18 acetylase RimI-like enzyme
MPRGRGAPSIRAVVPEDAEEIERLRVAGWQAAYRGIVPDSYLDSMRVDAERRAAMMISRPGTAAESVATAGDAVVGWVAGGRCRDTFRTGPRQGEIYACYVLPEWWGRGVGRLLLGHAVRMLAEAGLDDVTLWVLEGNHRARRFYEACGFKPDGARQLLDLGGLVPEVRYQLAAAPAGRRRQPA